MKLVTRWTFGSALVVARLTVQAAPQLPPPGQVVAQVETCLHREDESAAERLRREEALAAMRMIDWVLGKTMLTYPQPLTWAEMANRPAVRELQAMEGRVGDLARTMKWGSTEPLPGWRMSWPSGPAIPRLPLDPLVVFALIDMRDPCGFRYNSNNADVIQARKPGVRLLDPD